VGSLNDGSTEVDLRVYKNKLTNLVVQDWSTPGGGFDQGDGFSIKGFEATFTQKIKNTKGVLNYAWTKIEADKLIYAKDFWFATGAPHNNISLLVMHDFGKSLNGSFGYYYTGTYQQLCCEVDQQAPRKRLDLTLSKSLRLAGYDSKLKLVMQNVSNEKIDSRLFNDYHRQGYVSLGIQL
jgi:outer membrane receptor protein involved in Fe transport